MKLFVLVLLLFAAGFTQAQDILNLTNAKRLVSQYYKSGKFDRDVDSIVAVAMQQLDQCTINRGDAAVFDVDETAVSNYSHIASMDFGFRLDIWNNWVREGAAPAIPQVRKLYDALRAKGVKIIFLTGRMDEFVPATRKNLAEQGYEVYDTLITREKNDGFQSTGAFKTATREKLDGSGYHIIMCVGDQESDMLGGHTGIKVKIPDYIYLID